MSQRYYPWGKNVETETQSGSMSGPADVKKSHFLNWVATQTLRLVGKTLRLTGQGFRSSPLVGQIIIHYPGHRSKQAKHLTCVNHRSEYRSGPRRICTYPSPLTERQLKTQAMLRPVRGEITKADTYTHMHAGNVNYAKYAEVSWWLCWMNPHIILHLSQMTRHLFIKDILLLFVLQIPGH